MNFLVQTSVGRFEQGAELEGGLVSKREKRFLDQLTDLRIAGLKMLDFKAAIVKWLTK